MLASKTAQNIDRISSALSDTTDVAANYNATTGVIVHSTWQAHVSSVSDEKLKPNHLNYFFLHKKISYLLLNVPRLKKYNQGLVELSK